MRFVEPIHSYPAPLSPHGQDALAGRESVPSSVPADWFEPCFARFTRDEAMERVLETVGKGLVNVYVTEGRSRPCRYCFRDTGPVVSSMPWPWILELLEAFAAREAEIREKAHPNFRKGLLARAFGWADNDPIRDYHDPVYGKNFADVCEAVFDRSGERSFSISTSGWETGSVGEEAARGLLELARSRGLEVRYQLHRNTESAWFEDLGRDGYVDQMRPVFALVKETAGSDWRERETIGVGYGHTESHHDPDLLADIFQEDCYTAPRASTSRPAPRGAPSTIRACRNRPRSASRQISASLPAGRSCSSRSSSGTAFSA